MILSKEEKKELIREIKRELNEPQIIYVEICKENVLLPEYQNIGDAGMDVRSASEITLAPGETKIIPTGLKMVIPEGYEIQVRPRSGLSLKTPLRVSNSPGTIDSGYRDEIGIIITNTSTSGENNIYNIDEKGNKPGTYIIHEGDRIAQIVLIKFETIEFKKVEVGKVGLFGNNRGGGMGSTGVE